MAAPGLKRLAGTGTIFLVRHAAAGDRDKWAGHDPVRTLTKKGRRESQAIAEYLHQFGIERIYSSPYVRCVESMEPLAEMTGAKIIEHDALAEGPDIDAAYDGYERVDTRPRVRVYGCCLPIALGMLLAFLATITLLGNLLLAAL